MAGGMQSLDQGLPGRTQGKSTEDSIKEIHDYLYMLLENLRFMLSNLGTENFNEVELDSLTAPVYRSLSDLEGNLTQVAVTAEGAVIAAQNAQGDATAAQITADGARIVAQSAQGEVQSLEFTVDGLRIAGDGKTTIDGSKLTSQGTYGTTTINGGRVNNTSGSNQAILSSGRLELKGNVSGINHSAYIGLESERLYIRSGVAPIKIEALGNMSIDANNTLYVNASTGATGDTSIGRPGNRIDLTGDVYINGVLYNPTSA